VTEPPPDLDALIEEITVDAYGEDEQLTSFLTVLQEAITGPVPGGIAGEVVLLLGVDYDGVPEHGLRAIIQRRGRTHQVTLHDLAFRPGTDVGRFLAAYRKWALPRSVARGGSRGRPELAVCEPRAHLSSPGGRIDGGDAA
jgi:hypothetical protein